ncbi:MAG: hypothetical protein AB8B87_13680 [Granulosicoccus sp.]
MTHVHSHPTNHRFAWLTPLQGRVTSTGPWVLCENRTQHLENSDIPCITITVSALLQLLAASFPSEEPGGQQQSNACDSHISQCGRFKALKQRQDNCSSRLFVQKRSDYYQRLELHVDDTLVASYQEPVWPHLQHQHPATMARLTIPAACVEMLESAARSQASNCNSCGTVQPALLADTSSSEVEAA